MYNWDCGVAMYSVVSRSVGGKLTGSTVHLGAGAYAGRGAQSISDLSRCLLSTYRRRCPLTQVNAAGGACRESPREKGGRGAMRVWEDGGHVVVCAGQRQDVDGRARGVVV